MLKMHAVRPDMLRLLARSQVARPDPEDHHQGAARKAQDIKRPAAQLRKYAIGDSQEPNDTGVHRISADAQAESGQVAQSFASRPCGEWWLVDERRRPCGKEEEEKCGGCAAAVVVV